jgi:uncharacterized protein YraI
MAPFWRSNSGKLIIGGCGTQLGMLLGLGGLLVTLLFCSACVLFNVVGIGLSQRVMADLPADASPMAEAAPPQTLESTLAEINALLTELEILQANGVAIAPANAAGQPAAIVDPAAKAMVLVGEGGANLYSGPGASYSELGMSPAGEQLEIAGRNDDSSWWLVTMPNGLFAWVSAATVTTLNVNDTIPVITIPDQLVQEAASGSSPDTGTPAATEPTPTPTLPPGTPTPTSDQERTYVEDLPSFQKVKGALLVPPEGATFAPDGSRLAMSEGIKLYLVEATGGYTEVLLEENGELKPVGSPVWSPDGQQLAFVVDFKNRPCPSCRAVAILTVADGSIIYLDSLENLDTDAPRWTQDGRLLINAHPTEPADGATYVFDRYGSFGQEATGTYLLSSSYDGQKWYPWLPGRIWRAGVSERPDSYYKD